MFKDFDRRHLELIYQGLKALIESGSGYGFHNHDMGHSVYMLGSQREKITDSDSPEKNTLFQMLSELTKELKKIGDVGYNWFYDFSDWQKFCQFAINIYDKRRSQRSEE